MEIIKMPIGEIKPYEKNARKNDEAVNAVIESIKQCEYVAPIVVDENNVILAGHTRLKALKKLGVNEVEVCVKPGLTDEQKRKYRLLDNKTNEIAEWDFEMLADELDGLDFGELELDWGVEKEKTADEVVEDEAPDVDEENPPICKLGDIWQLGEHRLMCGDSTDGEQVERLCGDDFGSIDLVVTDPPYNVDISNSQGLKIANDNMTNSAFVEFLTQTFKNLANSLKSGGGVLYLARLSHAKSV